MRLFRLTQKLVPPLWLRHLLVTSGSFSTLLVVSNPSTPVLAHHSTLIQLSMASKPSRLLLPPPSSYVPTSTKLPQKHRDR